MRFERVTIVGVGLLGASLGLALKGRGLAREVVGVGRAGSASLKVARERGAIDVMSTEVAEGVRGSEMVVLCTPVRQFPEMMKGVVEGLGGRGGTGRVIVTDVGSTKQQVMAWGRKYFAGVRGVSFVGSHPMAGSERRGPEAARADLYEGALCLVCEGNGWGGKVKKGRSLEVKKGAGGKSGEAVEIVEAMWRGVGMRTLRLTAREHDGWVANVSHLVHAAAFGLAETVGQKRETMQAAAGGFFDTTRVAGSDVEMWTDIFLTNGKAAGAAMGRYIRTLEGIKKAIEGGDEAGLRKHLARAKEVRDGAVDWRRKPEGNRQ